MGLSNYQLLLLDNLIYLDTIADASEGYTTIEQVVHDLLYAKGSDVIGSGAIDQDYHNSYKPDDPDAWNCMMNKDEWIEVLLAIEADPVLCSLKIHTVENHKGNDDSLDGFRAMALEGSDEIGENVIIFKGTTSAEEWMEDNAFVVSGHSKGGNMAQYAFTHHQMRLRSFLKNLIISK